MYTFTPALVCKLSCNIHLLYFILCYMNYWNRIEILRYVYFTRTST